MKNSYEWLFGVGLAILALLILLTVNQSWETFRSPLSDSTSSVTDLGLRTAMQR
jgi:hypothetical protein